VDLQLSTHNRKSVCYSAATPQKEAGRLVRQAPDVTQTPHVNQTTRTGDGPSAQKIEALAEIICGAGDESAGALFVLMGTLERSTHPEVLAHTVKHLAFTAPPPGCEAGLCPAVRLEKELGLRPWYGPLAHKR
jgi:hypothetical protein